MERLTSIFNQTQDLKKEPGELWTDPLFPHDNSVTQKIKGSFKWLRAGQIFNNQERVYGSFSGNDIEQGMLNDNYLLSSLAVLCQRPHRVQRLFSQARKSPTGDYTVGLYVGGKRVEVVVDDYFPVGENDRPAFAGSKGKELWAMLIEKAWAKVHGSYSDIEQGSVLEALSALTGAPVDCIRHKDKAAKDLWELIKNFNLKNYILCVSAAASKNGIAKDHFYTVAGVREYIRNDEILQLVKLHTSWGTAEWSGQWNEDDPNWPIDLRHDLSPSKDNGSFVMSFKDFAETFDSTVVVKVEDDCVHSSCVVNKYKGAAAFQVGVEVKGFVSGHQVTPRLGKTIAKNYSLGRLNVELYKLEENLKLVKGGNSNSQGAVDLEVDLKPGLYVLRSELSSASKIPSVVLAAYTNIRVNFVNLNVEDFKEVNEKVIKAALKTLDCPYVSGAKLKEKRYPGAFRTCLKGHKLDISTAATEDGSIYTCENCLQAKNILEGRWNCKQCGYNICTACRPRNYGNIRHKEDDRSVIIVMCSKEHLMKFEPPPDTKDIYLCDKCGRAYYGTVSRWSCDECKQGLCRECMAAPQGFKSQGEVLSIDTCPAKHKLAFAVSETSAGVYRCYLCTKLGDSRSGRWTCLQCGVNVCYVCKPCSKAKDGLLSVGTKTLVCDKGHLLLFGCPKIKGEIACKKCGRVIEDGWRWNCKDCAYDICASCRPEPEGQREHLCCNLHKLGYSNLPRDFATCGRCCKCDKTVELAKGRYCCLPCQYECCKNCARAVLSSQPEKAKPAEDEPIVERTHRRPQKPVAEERVLTREPTAKKPLVSEEPIRKESLDEEPVSKEPARRLSAESQIDNDTPVFERSGKKPAHQEAPATEGNEMVPRENCGCSIF